MNGNGFMTWILRSPLHGILSNGMLLLTITGRKTGKQYTLPVGYYEENGSLWVITSRNRTWWKNLQGGAGVDLLIKHRLIKGFAEVELNEKNVQTRVSEYLRHVPQAAKPMGIRIENQIPNVEDTARIAKERLFVKISLS